VEPGPGHGQLTTEGETWRQASADHVAVLRSSQRADDRRGLLQVAVMLFHRAFERELALTPAKVRQLLVDGQAAWSRLLHLPPNQVGSDGTDDVLSASASKPAPRSE
jgi:hypothetical protein